MRKDPNKGDCIDNFKPISSLNAGLKILFKVLATRLALVVGDLIGEAQTAAISKSFVHN